MIVRILGEGQWSMSDDQVGALNEFDATVESAVENGDEAGLASALTTLLEQVRTNGTPVADEEVVVSDLVLPYSDASLDDVRDLLSGDGLIPG